MRRISLALLLTLVACAEHGSSAPPAGCGCVSDTPVVELSDCCNSTTCYFNDDTDEWEVHGCDALPPVDPCDACGPGSMCVQRYDGTCGLGTFCEPMTVSCPALACSPECEAAYCGGEPFQCQVRNTCGTESPAAFTCYGP